MSSKRKRRTVPQLRRPWEPHFTAHFRWGWAFVWGADRGFAPSWADAFPYTANPFSDPAQLRGEVYIMAMKRQAAKTEGTTSGTYAEDRQSAKICPTLYAHLTETKWEDGTVRVPSTLTIFAAEGVFKALLKDRSEGICLWVASQTLGTLFGALEAALCDPEAIWRIDRPPEGGSAKRVKKTS